MPEQKVRHLGVIMDGNRRWARQHMLKSVMGGHEKGVDTFIDLCEWCENADIPYLTVYAFSTENFRRSQQEVSDLFKLMRRFFVEEIHTCIEKGVKVVVVGNLSYLKPEDIKVIRDAEEVTKDCGKLYLQIALSYGGRDEILTLYLQYAEQANNWDLVDLSVHKILGHWLLLPSNLGDKDYKIKLLDDLAQSPCLWKQRMSMVCSWKTSQMGDPSWCLRYAEIHLHHPHDLMHKAVGWMLREMGKRVSMDLLRDFLRQHAHEMPRTMLRYAIEKMSDEERQYWMTIPQG